ncbi:hypothetical protein [Falsiroseomonas tokyonensis]|uniref:Uncharacterized protein n=1 Tax=Falsiroseomonas tokyonensis TaxID=430521 RepID=A0ABV7C3D2_9PROT|nr:hypothetical protein [Falsiroseomonas tokyonensis]MBU8541604.1 hypothetical protein [Falsiroseomonas tokyonensis]
MAGPTQFQNSGLLEACRLWRKVSAKGTEYLTGRLGGVKVTILPRRADAEGDHTHVMFFSEPSKRQEGGGR